MNWVDAIRGQQEISCPFEYAAQLTEVMLLGIVSLRAGGKIHYDGANRRVTNKVKSGEQPRRRGRSQPVPVARVSHWLDVLTFARPGALLDECPRARLLHVAPPS